MEVFATIGVITVAGLAITGLTAIIIKVADL